MAVAIFCFLLIAIEVLLHKEWILFIVPIVIFAAIIYAFVSSVRMEQNIR